MTGLCSQCGAIYSPVSTDEICTVCHYQYLRKEGRAMPKDEPKDPRDELTAIHEAANAVFQILLPLTSEARRSVISRTRITFDTDTRGGPQ